MSGRVRVWRLKPQHISRGGGQARELAPAQQTFGPTLTSYSTMRLLARSALLPARAITMLGLACLCSSFTHVFARANVS